MSLSDLGFAVDDFARGWPAAPISRAASSDVLNTLTLADIDDMVANRGLRTASLRLMIDGEIVNPREYLWAGRAVEDSLADARAVARQVKSGSTLIIQDLEQIHPPAGRLARSVACDLGTEIFINSYITPPGVTGFPEHADEYHAFLVQLIGAKRWELRSSADVPAEPVTLRVGDVLWIPRGWRHAGVAMPGDPSVHLTIAARPVTVARIINQVLAVIPDTLRKAVLQPRTALDSAELRKTLEHLVGCVTEAMSQADLNPVVRDVTWRLTEFTSSPDESISAALGDSGDSGFR